MPKRLIEQFPELEDAIVHTKKLYSNRWLDYSASESILERISAKIKHLNRELLSYDPAEVIKQANALNIKLPKNLQDNLNNSVLLSTEEVDKLLNEKKLIIVPKSCLGWQSDSTGLVLTTLRRISAINLPSSLNISGMNLGIYTQAMNTLTLALPLLKQVPNSSEVLHDLNKNIISLDISDKYSLDVLAEVRKVTDNSWVFTAPSTEAFNMINKVKTANVREYQGQTIQCHGDGTYSCDAVRDGEKFATLSGLQSAIRALNK